MKSSQKQEGTFLIHTKNMSIQVGISLGMPGLLICIHHSASFPINLLAERRGTAARAGNEDREGKDADGGVAAALSRRGKVWAGRTDSTTECGWEGGAKSSIHRLRESRRFHPK